MNLLNWIAGAGHRRDRRTREERRHRRRRRDDLYEIHHHGEPRWPASHSDQYSYGRSTGQEPRIIFVSPGPQDLADRHSEDSYWQHRRHHRRRRHERVHHRAPERPHYAHAADIPENWYRQQYSPPLTDPEPEYENHHRRRYSYSDDHGTRSYRPPSPGPSSPRSTWSFKGQETDPPPIYDLETQRALEESYAQAGSDRRCDRDRSRDRFSSSSAEIPIVDELDERLRREQQRDERCRQRDIIRRDSIDQERRHRIAELQAEIQARELQQELRDRGRGLEGDRDRRQRPSSGGSGYRSPSVSDVNGLADRLGNVDLHPGRRSLSPLPSPYREREQFVGSLGGSSWIGSGSGRRSPSREGSIRDLPERGREAEGYYLRPRVRFSPAVNYEPDFFRRPRVYFRSAEPEDLYGDGGWGSGGHW